MQLVVELKDLPFYEYTVHVAANQRVSQMIYHTRDKRILVFQSFGVPSKKENVLFW